MYLLNCRNCDDVLRLGPHVRRCDCGQTSGHLDGTRIPPIVEGFHARVLKIDWEQYDSAVPGETRRWQVWTFEQFMSKSSGADVHEAPRNAQQSGRSDIKKAPLRRKGAQ